MNQKFRLIRSMALTICILLAMLPWTAQAESLTGDEDTPVLKVENEGELKKAFKSTTPSAITITEQPRSITVKQGSISGSLSVSAEADNGNDVSYQWWVRVVYEENYEEKYYEEEITGATENTFPIPADLTQGIYYYSCIISAEGCENAVSLEAEVAVRKPGSLGVFVGKTEVDNENKNNITGTGITGSVSYNPDTKTLTLNNAVISGDEIDIAIRSDDDIKVELLGSSRLGTAPEDGLDSFKYAITNGIYADGKSVTLTGSGSLIIYDLLTGIEAKDITVDITGALTIMERGGSRACCLKADGGTLTIRRGALNLASYYSNCLYGDRIVINGGTITAHSFSAIEDEPLFAFNRVPIFGSGYSHGVFAGSEASSAKKITNPTVTDFTESKYVRIEPKTSGSSGDDGDDDKDKGSGGAPISSEPNAPDTEIILTFSPGALSSLSGEINVTSTKVDPSELSAEARQKVGNHPVFDISVTADGKNVSDFDGAVTVSVPYTPKTGEDLDAIVAYYINSKGEPKVLINSGYDNKTGCVVFTAEHFPRYAVGYNKVSFTDVKENDWYEEAVTFIAAREITSGTGGGNFSPQANLTRGQFIVMLMKAYGIAPDTKTADNFADAGNTWYTDYLAAAKRLGISQGTGNNLFEPDKEISRQELFTLLYNVLEWSDSIPEGNSEIKLSDFNDSDLIAEWAENAASSLAKSGIITGSAGNLNPSGTATRAEMAQILYRLLSK